MASSGLRKMLTSIISNTGWCHGVGMSCNFMDNFYYVEQLLNTLADVIAFCCIVCGRCCNHQVDVITCVFVVVDVVTTKQML